MSVTTPKGLAASGIHAGIRQKKKDVALVRSVVPAVGAAMFSRNKVQAACLQINRAHLDAAEPQAVVINSGVANSATGELGLTNAKTTAAHTAALLGVTPEQVLVLSTGVIGVQLPMDALLPGIDAAFAALAADGGADAAEAIMTTDTKSKQTVVAGGGFSVGGMAKGAGMIHPDLATMLAILTTDYPLEQDEVIGFLQPAVDTTFNAITIDGDCSTNDTVLLLANGASQIERTPATDAAFAGLLRLARLVVADGRESARRIRHGADDEQARAIARRIATSPLVKTALFGHDANWGRVLMAAGSAPWNGGYAAVEADRITLRYNGTVVLDAGTPTEVEPDVSGPSCTIDLDLGLGSGTAGYLTSDLSYDYVRINADYRT
jgi:glutamate N-acetyltransferase/amino-acid N-acetyltransferase